ncbi:MAG TPA: DUF2961 domain-containing protein [bacterium]
MLDTLQAQVVHFSSYDRGSGNNDQGNYYGTDSAGWQVLCDVTGPGVIAEVWSTMLPLAPDIRLRLYVDNLTTALIDTPLISFFGRAAPFVPPLADTSSGGFFSYVPIPFSSRARITYNGPPLYFHVTALTYPAGTTMTPLTMPPGSAYMARLDSLRSRFANPLQPAWPSRSTVRQSASAALAAGQSQELLHYTGRGGCRRLMVRIGTHTQPALENVWLRVYSDHNPLPDIEGPLSTVFGAALGWWPYRSVFTGFSGDSLYLNLPLVFRSEFRVELENRTGSSQTVNTYADLVTLSAQETPPFKVRGVYREENPTPAWAGHKIADVQGAGTYLGMLLDAQTTDGHILEGDETIALDGEATPSWRGTGTEDYFDGGYYWNDGAIYQALGFHGCIRFAGYIAAAYRWHVTDPVPFTNRFQMDIEVGGWNQLQGHYRTMAYFCMTPPRWTVVDADSQSFAGQNLRLVGTGLTPLAELTDVHLGTTSLSVRSGAGQVSVDSVLDVTVTMPSGLASGIYPLSAVLSTGTETVAAAWPYFAAPEFSFAPVRQDLDTCVFGGDTLAVDISGLPSGTTVSLFAESTPLSWMGATPTADGNENLHGLALIPGTLSYGDHALRATAPPMADVVCGQALKVRPFVRYELEALTLTSWRWSTQFIGYAPDWILPTSTEPWGRNLVRDISANGVGDYGQFAFTLPSGGVFQPVYFFGTTNSGVIVRTKIDDSVDVAGQDTYNGPIVWRWDRSDSVRGRVQPLAAGPHTVRFEVAGRNPSSIGWTMILDQIVLQAQVESSPAPPPQPVSHVVAFLDSINGVRLCWPPVTQDSSGEALTPSGYRIYRTAGLDTAFALFGQVGAMDTTFVDTTRANIPVFRLFYYVKAVANGGVGGTSALELPAQPREMKGRRPVR